MNDDLGAKVRKKTIDYARIGNCIFYKRQVRVFRQVVLTAGGEIIDCNYLIASLQKQVDHSRPNLPRATGNKNLHLV